MAVTKLAQRQQLLWGTVMRRAAAVALAAGLLAVWHASAAAPSGVPGAAAAPSRALSPQAGGARQHETAEGVPERSSGALSPSKAAPRAEKVAHAAPGAGPDSASNGATGANAAAVTGDVSGSGGGPSTKGLSEFQKVRPGATRQDVACQIAIYCRKNAPAACKACRRTVLECRQL